MLERFIATAHAAAGDPVVIPGAPALIPDCARAEGGATTLACGMELFANISQILLGIVGALVLILFVYGGILYMTSRGGENVKKATAVLQGSAVGLLIVFGAFSAVNFAVNALRGSDGGTGSVSEYVTCSSGTDADGKPIPIAGSDSKACGPGLVCNQGLCADKVVPPTN